MNKIRTLKSIDVSCVNLSISTPLGASNKSIINKQLNFGPNNKNVNASFLTKVRNFIAECDGA